MVVWTDNAISHITEFIDEARTDTEETAKAYMNKLVDYADILETMPEIGKKMEYVISNYEIRQMLYKKHRIFYHIKGNEKAEENEKARLWRAFSRPSGAASC